jgi:16S rRNA processing protein RimM
VTATGLPVARIGAAHGVRGEVRLTVYSGDAAALARYGSLHDGAGRRFSIRSLRQAGKGAVAAFAGIDDRNGAEALAGVELLVDRAEAAESLGPGEFLAADLLGLTAVTADGAVFGTVGGVADFGAGNVLEIRLAGGGSEMFAFTGRNFPVVDIAGRWLVIDPPAIVSGEAVK